MTKKNDKQIRLTSENSSFRVWMGAGELQYFQAYSEAYHFATEVFKKTSDPVTIEQKVTEGGMVRWDEVKDTPAVDQPMLAKKAGPRADLKRAQEVRDSSRACLQPRLKQIRELVEQLERQAAEPESGWVGLHDVHELSRLVGDFRSYAEKTETLTRLLQGSL